MMKFAMFVLILCYAVLEFANSSQDAVRVRSVHTIYNENRVINAKDLVLHEEDMLKSVKCENIEKG